MKVIYVTSGIRKPFAFIDHSVIQAMKKLGLEVRVMHPGRHFQQRWERLRKKQNPDFLLTMLGERLTAENLQLIESFSFPKAIWYTDDPYAIDRSLQTCHLFDWVFTNESEALPVYQKSCKGRIVHLPLAAHPLVYKPLKKVPSLFRSQIAMVGSAFQNRFAVVEKISPCLKKYRTRLIGPGWDRLSASSSFLLRGGWIKPEEVCQYYNGAKIVLNIHRAFDDPYLKQNRHRIGAQTPNNRLFEIAACASFQIIDAREDLRKFYDPDREIAVCRSLEDLKEKIAFYLPREQLRKKMAFLAYQRTIREHLYEHRIQVIVRHILKNR
ncbi:glycosyltransferase [Paenactinomyces guangxiensis]|uniref:Glycosyltransferase n=1 Tax=Paenactinomyces guangxiensis TaxID=1490290 RepID=A0A7W1WRA9_9BACL|nr:glycosyltransferase [Paenactinomyces guangxiensis]MBA4494474.1 glycosyltransferase [Paenactinomyces guangxiensis]MBH8591471.1 glycosyltransferase [Paenactinomyces guangxiensis]